MIEINLLPVSMRKVEGTPLPRLLVTYLGIIVACVLLWLNLQFILKEIPQANREKDQLSKELKEAEESSKRLDVLEAEIEDIGAHVESVKDLYRGRVIWAKILYDLKMIVNADESLNRENSDRRYLWITDLKLGKSGKGGASEVVLNCFASAPTTANGTTIVRNFLNNLAQYRPKEAPETQMRKMLEETLQRMEFRRRQGAQQTEEGELPPKTPEQLETERQLEALKTRASGRIATMPFSDLIYGDSINYSNMTWSEVTKPPVGTEPASRWKFDVTMLLKPPAPPKPVESKKKKK